MLLNGVEGWVNTRTNVTAPTEACALYQAALATTSPHSSVGLLLTNMYEWGQHQDLCPGKVTDQVN